MSTAGSRASVGVLLGMAGLVMSQACGPEASRDTGPVGDADWVLEVLASVGPHVVLPALARFEGDMENLGEAVDALVAALESGEGLKERALAQEQWRVAMTTWQELELLQIGPLASSLTAVAGEDLRDEVYSWPTVNACRIDQKTVEEGWGDPGFFEANLVNAYGMDALEHVLFAASDCACPSPVNPVADGSWDALGEEGIAQSRAAFAQALVIGVADQVDRLQTRWNPEEEDFSGLLAGAEPPYESPQEGLNAVFDALFYLETSTKDAKLAYLAGLADCGGDTCAEEVEGVLSDTTLSSIGGNLAGYELLFTGGEGVGMADLLESRGHGDLATETLDGLQVAEAALAQAQEISAEEVLSGSSETLLALYEAVARVTDVLKGDMVTVLSLQVPSEAAGDND